jgi:hypothetical protein
MIEEKPYGNPFSNLITLRKLAQTYLQASWVGSNKGRTTGLHVTCNRAQRPNAKVVGGICTGWTKQGHPVTAILPLRGEAEA